MSNKLKGIVAVIILASLVVMVSVSLQESGTTDELAHIPSGYGYVKYLDYRLNPEHPPLVKMFSALPLLFLNPNFPTDSTAWTSDVNGQWKMGSLFLYQSGNDADQIIQLSRVGPMILTLILIAFVYIWSRELFGEKWALLPTAVTAFSPTILAHGHYVTTDIGAALGTLVAIYYFVKYINSPSRKHLIWAGIAFGVAMLMKFSTVLLVPLFLLIVFIKWLIEIYETRDGIQGNKIKHFIIRGLRHLGYVSMIFLIGFLVLYPFYFLTTFNYPPGRQYTDTEFILSSFAGGPTPEGEICNPMRCIAEFNIWASNKPVLRPYAEYMLGVLMVIQRSAGGNTAYFLGRVSASGSRLYFPTLYVLKESLSILILIAVGLLYGLYNIISSIVKKKTSFTNYLGTHLAEFSILLFTLIYAAWSISSPLNIGIRHLLPIMPLTYILMTSSLKKWTQSGHLNKKIKLGFISVMLVWFAVSTAVAYPFYLSYFNEFIGTNNGWKIATDSNYDWGQDLKRLANFVNDNNIEKIAIDYFGAGSPEYYIGNKVEGWNSAKGNPLESGIRWIAVSVNTIQGSTAPKAEGFERRAEDEFRWIQNPQEPYAKAGTSIFIYKLD